MVLKCCQFHVFTGVYFQVVTSSRQLQVFISKYRQLVFQYNFRNFEVLAFTWFCFIITYSSTYCLPLLTGVISQCCFSVFFYCIVGLSSRVTAIVKLGGCVYRMATTAL